MKGPENIFFCDFCLCCFVGMSLWKTLIWAPIRNLKQFYLSAWMNLKKLSLICISCYTEAKKKNPHIRSWKFVFASHMHLLNAPFKEERKKKSTTWATKCHKTSASEGLYTCKSDIWPSSVSWKRQLYMSAQQKDDSISEPVLLSPFPPDS